MLASLWGADAVALRPRSAELSLYSFTCAAFGGVIEAKDKRSDQAKSRIDLVFRHTRSAARRDERV
jgi:hypothetical protein